MASVGPWSVVRYLEFAIGRGIGDAEDDQEDEELHGPAVGMERVARRYDPDAFDGESVRTVDNSTIGPTRASSLRSVGYRPPSLETDDIKKESCAAAPKDEPPTHDDASTSGARAPRYFYGFAGEKIGQACVSWLCRWGVDILPIEEEMARTATEATEVTGADSDGKSKDPPLVGRMRGISLSETGSKQSPARHTHSASWTAAPETPVDAPPRTASLRIWARGGLTAEWVRIVISSDAFWVRNEMERYEFAKRVVALRSGESLAHESEEEEAREADELALIFERGIYYSHMVRLLSAHTPAPLTSRRLSSNFRSFPPI